DAGTGPTQIIGNYIGTDATGALPRGNLDDGVRVSSANNQVLKNIISANIGEGVLLDGPLATGNVLLGNSIGTDAAGTTNLANLDNGIFILDGASHNVVGGVMAGQGNHIAFNGDSGIDIAGDESVGNTISGNAIFDNGDLGIDLNDDGPTA